MHQCINVNDGSARKEAQPRKVEKDKDPLKGRSIQGTSPWLACSEIRREKIPKNPKQKSVGSWSGTKVFHLGPKFFAQNKLIMVIYPIQLWYIPMIFWWFFTNPSIIPLPAGSQQLPSDSQLSGSPTWPLSLRRWVQPQFQGTPHPTDGTRWD